MDIKQEKHTLRQWVRQEQQKLTPLYRKTADADICQKICALPAYQQAQTVLFFVSTPNEIQTEAILQQAWSDGKRVVVPRCAKQGQMAGYLISSMQDLEKGKYDILEPKQDCILIEKEQIDFAVIPCMAADASGNRLGHGGGYYDRYLSDTVFPTAAICYTRFLLPHIPTEAHDQKMRFIITEDR